MSLAMHIPDPVPAMQRCRFLPMAVLLGLACGAQAQDARHEWPEGSAMHTLYVEVERLEASRAALARAHARLLDAFHDAPDDRSPLAHLVASQHAQWLAYRATDCELAGMLTGAGGAWPQVHGLTCQNQLLAERIEVVDKAAACLRRLPAGYAVYEQYECLQGLVAWSMVVD